MYLFLINPEAGHKRFLKIETGMRQLLDKLLIPYKFVIVNDLAETDTLLKENLSPKLKGVAAVGGNATVSAVINALVGEELPLAIIPMSGNNFFAHSLGIRRWDQAIRMLTDPDMKSQRLGKVGSQYFVGRIEILSHTNLLNRHMKRSSLLTKFLGLGAKTNDSDHDLATSITIDEETRVSGAITSIEADLNPEKEYSKLHLILATGDVHHPEITQLWANSFTVDSDRKMAIVIGNETVGQTPMEIKGLAKYIKLLVPKKAEKIKRV